MDKRVGLVAFLAAFTVCAALVSLLFGAREMGFGATVSAVRDGITLAFSGGAEQLEAASDEAKIIAQLRVPRTLLGLLVGAALGTAGALLQGHTRNPLADTNLLGVGPGAALAVAAAISFHGSMTVLGTVGVGFLGAILAVALVFALSMRSLGSSPIMVVLGGSALGAVCSALTSGIVLTNTQSLNEMRFWTAGAIAGRDMQVVAVLAPVMLLGLVLAFGTAHQVNLLNLGDDVASALGVRVNIARAVGIIVVALLTGAAVAGAGPIGFVGLVVPHLVRAFTGPDYRWVLPCSALAGASLLLLADVIGRIIARPGELQVGITLAFVGAPFALYLLRKGAKL
ncbi:iron ABC transporter permease [Corynebacterium sp. HMSC071B10]|uniref:FecCD family ABC transporter permease n=1 Tax=Corynebacterium sp. HMSC074A01 TaxID=1715030 RepID=UPI0008A10FD0|nr:iron ABC transporter permease [Corynebacterium sp. HMSC074A01]OFP36850.1 iron ABC transporter permease [Corynebacterium sp. HMSC071B10]OHF38279.1 iron ABC transporter permease [Corynebacterium sp. HMSC074A01]